MSLLSSFNTTDWERLVRFQWEIPVRISSFYSRVKSDFRVRACKIRLFPSNPVSNEPSPAKSFFICHLWNGVSVRVQVCVRSERAGRLVHKLQPWHSRDGCVTTGMIVRTVRMNCVSINPARNVSPIGAVIFRSLFRWSYSLSPCLSLSFSIDCSISCTGWNRNNESNFQLKKAWLFFPWFFFWNFACKYLWYPSLYI